MNKKQAYHGAEWYWKQSTKKVLYTDQYLVTLIEVEAIPIVLRNNGISYCGQVVDWSKLSPITYCNGLRSESLTVSSLDVRDDHWPYH